MLQKITTGYVVQDFDEKSGKCVDQYFIAGDGCEWVDSENNSGIYIDEPANIEYFPYNMIQPTPNTEPKEK